jgi:hypothetical protein
VWEGKAPHRVKVEEVFEWQPGKPAFRLAKSGITPETNR